MSVDLSFEISFLSDWGVGTGTGRGGDVDKVIAKDSTGLPIVPGKTLTGMLRDACEEAAYALDGGGPGAWHAWLRWLFGDEPAKQKMQGRPWPAALSIRPGTLGSSAQARARHQRRFAQAAVVIRPGVRIKPETGVAEDDTLRMEERALSGLKVVSPASLNADELPREARVLLVSGARLLDRIGGRRRRGAGRCAVTIVQSGVSLAAVHEDFAQPSVPPPPTTVPWEPAASMGTSLSTYSFEITCLTPVVASAGVKGNTVQTLDYIPGYLLFPIVARALGGDAADLITTGRIKVSDATPAPKGKRMLPVPLSLQRPKGVHTDPVTLHNALRGEPDEGQRYVPMKQGWLDPQGALSPASILRVDLMEQAHAVIDDQAQRPTEQSGGLYVQQAIPAGTVLHFEVDLPAEPKLVGKHSIGRSKKDDYGHVEIRRVEHLVTRVQTTPSSQVIAYVESDVLLHDENLNPTTSATELARQVADALQVAYSGDLRAYHAVRRHETWSARWGLPRPSLVAVKAGTVIRFAVDGQAKDATVLHLGTRQAEGFGRVLINPAFLSDSAGPESNQDSESEAQAIQSRLQDVDENSRIIGEAMRRRSLSEAVLACDVTEISRTLELDKFTNSQLGLLRELLAVQVSGKVPLRGDLKRNQPPNETLAQLLDDAEKVRLLLQAEGDYDAISARRVLLTHCIRHARVSSDDSDGVSA